MFQGKYLAPVGEPYIVVDRCNFYERYTVIAMIRTDNKNNPIIITGSRESNTQWEFVEFIFHLITSQFLVFGDYLILNNATIHLKMESSELLNDLLESAGVKMVLLPTYSPELNPIELVFGFVKCYLRE